MGRTTGLPRRQRWQQGRGSGVALAALLVLAPGLGGCSIKSMIAVRAADALAGGGGVWAADDDPQLVREALPFALKTAETLVAMAPGEPKPLLAACVGFTQYAYAFVDTDALELEARDYLAGRRERERALRLYLRARDYCLAALDTVEEDLSKRLIADPSAANELGAKHLDLLYWSAASWGSAIALGQNRPELAADLPVVRALIERALALDEDYLEGALHQAMIPLEAVPAAMGGSKARARQSFERAVELSHGRSAAPYVSFAWSVSIAEQNREQFLEKLEAALAIDADATASRELRLANLVNQRRARILIDRVDDYFLADAPEDEP